MESGATSLLQAMRDTVARLEGAYALAAIDVATPDEVVAARSGSPLVVGVGIGEHFLASDTLALRQVTDRFIYLEEGDVVACSAAGPGDLRQRRRAGAARDEAHLQRGGGRGPR
jgi:glucosamine--fructose-6-phosphate aminotransferase (isomerizing)